MILPRLKSLQEPNREVDAEIWLATTEGATRRTTTAHSATGAWPDYFIDETRDASGHLISVPRYTASLDAAVALVEKMLPDANCWGVERSPAGFDAYVSRNNVDAGHWYHGAEHKTSAAIALLIALFTALEPRT